MSEPDSLLIAEFNVRRSEEAFAALVRQHVNLVFATALRQVGDRGAAEEITQNVFVALAQGAGKLGSHPTLAGWLYQTTLNKSREWLRSELRRRRREQVAASLALARAEGDSVWSQLVPLLDEALLELREPDRLAVVLHFMEGRTFHEVGSTLGISEDAARKRAGRCLDQLTHFFRRHGFEMPALAAGTPLFALASHAAPAGLAASVTTAGLTATSTSTLTLAKGALKTMAWTKTKTSATAGIIAIVLILATGYWAWLHFGNNNRLPVGDVTPKITMGKGFGIILASNGSLWSWGEEVFGSPTLGLNNVNHTTALRRIGPDTNWVDVAVSDSDCLAVKSDGTMWGWGINNAAQLGNETSLTEKTPARAVPGHDWKCVAIGDGGLAIKRDGTLWAWGKNSEGQLGIGDATQAPEPVQVGTSTQWMKIWSSSIQTVGLQSDGSLWFCGSLRGPKPADVFRVPTRVSPDTNWVDASIGWYTVFAVKSDGTLWCFGEKAGVYSQTPGSVSLTPLQIGTEADWKACASYGGYYTVLLKKDGTVWTLNYNQGTIPTIRQINLHKDTVAIAACINNVGVTLTRDGAVWTWGTVFGEHSADYVKRALKEGKRPSFTLRDEPWQLSVVHSGH